ncbi:MAG: NADH:ubiquinone oxidoreductase [Planctomycetes bacterium]|nr:NADH:ubiquinone oxidoreductase [Planctomycetota bacterium]
MDENGATKAAVQAICREHGNDRTRMLDILRDVQRRFGFVSDEAMDEVAEVTGCARIDVESVVSFYAFLSDRPQGRIVIRLCNDVVDELKGMPEVAAAFRRELGIAIGETTSDGFFTLAETPCIGMCDQAPAVLVNDVVVTDLDPDRVRRIVHRLRYNPDPSALVTEVGDGNNGHPLVRAMVRNNVRRAGEVIFSDRMAEAGLQQALRLTPERVIEQVKQSKLCGRGGAGFPTGRKWEFTRAAQGGPKYIICNADEGEPGTFKDRVLLTERPDLLFEGMTIAAYAIGASEGILYLRGEYAYLRRFLEHVLEERRRAGLLGQSILGVDGFDFDIRIQLGAGSYVCGEETALISSCEGQRGDPKNRPPFPAEKGFLGRPTCVNNVETLCKAARILEEGPDWFRQWGTESSAGTKLLSISGDCLRPGIYEVPFGVKLSDVLKLCGARDAGAVLVGGPSGRLVAPADFDERICFEELPTGGAIVVFDSSRDLLRIVSRYLAFFIDESCGHCTPCRVGNVLLKERIDRLRRGQGERSDLEYLERLARTIQATSRCGLGQTSPRLVECTLRDFRSLYEACLGRPDLELRPSFDIRAALRESEALVGRDSVYNWNEQSELPCRTTPSRL